MRKLLEDAAKLARTHVPPARLYLTPTGVRTEMFTPNGQIVTHENTWRQLEDAIPGVNPLVFALAHCKRLLEKEHVQPSP